MAHKTLELMQSLVKICVPGGKVLDPFAGSGSTLEAARLEGYDAVGIEVNGEIAGMAAGRLGVGYLGNALCMADGCVRIRCTDPQPNAGDTEEQRGEASMD